MAQINPPKQVTFSNGKPYVGQYKKPFADIVLVGTKRIQISNVIVDTGADFLMVPQSAASNAGLTLGQAIKQNVNTASGTTTLLRLSNVSEKLRESLSQLMFFVIRMARVDHFLVELRFTIWLMSVLTLLSGFGLEKILTSLQEIDRRRFRNCGGFA